MQCGSEPSPAQKSQVPFSFPVDRDAATGQSLTKSLRRLCWITALSTKGGSPAMRMDDVLEAVVNDNWNRSVGMNSDELLPDRSRAAQDADQLSKYLGSDELTLLRWLTVLLACMQRTEQSTLQPGPRADEPTAPLRS